MSTDLTTTSSAGFGFGSGVNTYSGQPLSRAVARPVRRELDWVSGRAEVAAARDTARATLTHAALHNVGTLVSTCHSLMQVAPEGAAHYEALVNAYAAGAANAIARFQ